MNEKLKKQLIATFWAALAGALTTFLTKLLAGLASIDLGGGEQAIGGSASALIAFVRTMKL